MNTFRKNIMIITLIMVAVFAYADTKTSSIQMLDSVNSSIDAMIAGKRHPGQIEESINQLDFAHSTLQSVARHEFETLQRLTAQTAGYLVELSKATKGDQECSGQRLYLFKTYFELLIRVQQNMQTTFDTFDFDARLENMLPFIQSRSALNHAKISLLDMTAQCYPRIAASDGNIHRETVLYMLDQFDYKKIESDPDINKDHSIIVLTKLVNTIDLLQSQYSDGAESGDAYITTVKKSQREFSERLALAIEKKAKLYEQAPQDMEATFEKRRLTFEEMYPLYNAAAYFQMGTNASECDTKIAHFTDAIRLKPDFLAAYVNRGICYDSMEKFDLALLDFDRAIELDPLYKAAWYNRGMTHLHLKKYATAIEDFERVFSLDQNDKAALLNLGACYQNLEQFEKAVEYYEIALRIDPFYVPALRNRGRLNQSLKNFESAIDDYEKILERSPDDATTLYNIGIIYYDLGEWQKVVDFWEKCLTIKPDHQQIKEYLPIAKRELAKERRE